MSYTCPRCGATSQHPTDEEMRYCGRCHRFESDEAFRDVLFKLDSIDPHRAEKLQAQRRSDAGDQLDAAQHPEHRPGDT